jgi:hypothetical protein
LKPITNSFTINKNSSNDDLAIIEVDNQRLYVHRGETVTVRSYSLSDLTAKHSILMRQQHIISELLSISDHATAEFSWWSYHVTWFTDTIFKSKVDNFTFELSKNKTRIKEIHAYYDNELAWHQVVIRKK